MSADLEYRLEEFRNVQNDFFKSDGTCKMKIIPHELCERMLELINELEIEVKDGATI